jgi:NAD(P)H-hydrate epimerase
VENGNVEKLFNPGYLVSLTLPKLGSKYFDGRHFLGGRFIPTCLVKKYNLKVPEYYGTNTILEITSKL